MNPPTQDRVEVALEEYRAVCLSCKGTGGDGSGFPDPPRPCWRCEGAGLEPFPPELGDRG